jgi:hypothetical protein
MQFCRSTLTLVELTKRVQDDKTLLIPLRSHKCQNIFTFPNSFSDPTVEWGMYV